MASLQQQLSVFSQAMNLRTQRHQVLASNIANADTPNYKARDFDFSTALKESLAGRGESSLQLSMTDARHLAGTTDASPARLMYRSSVQPSVDGNTVDMDVERGQFSENAMQYEASLTFLTGQIKTLLAAVAA